MPIQHNGYVNRDGLERIHMNNKFGLQDPDEMMLFDEDFETLEQEEVQEVQRQAVVTDLQTREEIDTNENRPISQLDFTIFDSKTHCPIAINCYILSKYILQEEELRFVPAQKGGVFYKYNQGKSRWEELTESAFNGMVLKHIQDTNMKKTANRMLSEVKTFLEAEENIYSTFSDFNELNGRHLVNCSNGLYNADTNELEEHSHKNLFTSTINANYISRKISITEAPNFHKFLKNAFRDDDLIAFVQEMLGYCLTWDVNAKCFFVNDGQTDTGKSTISNFIQKLISDDFCSNLDWQDFQDKKDIVGLYGKMINVSGDLPKVAITNKDKIKCLTGEDRISAWMLYVGNIYFINKAKIICNTNGMPDNYGDKSPAFYNRLKIIPYRFTVPKENQDKNLVNKFMEERDIIFTWAMKGYSRLVRNNYIFSKCELVDSSVESYKNKSSIVSQFVEDLCTLDKDVSIQKRWLFEEFSKYADQETSGSYKVNSKIFYKELIETYPEIREVKDSSQGGRWVFKGIKLS